MKLLGNLPDVQFVETDIDEILSEMIDEFEGVYYQKTGKQKKLYPGDPIRIFIYTQALRELQLREIINNGMKQNLLAYASGEHLDHFAARYAIERFDESFAMMTVRFELSTAIAALIPAGTRITIDGIYFETLQNTAINSGQVSEEVVVVCQVPGEIGNDVPAGTRFTIVDPLPFVTSVTSTEKSVGGADRESDEELRERVYSAPESLSVAGPEEAYKSITKKYSNAVLDVVPLHVSPGVVEVIVLLENGELPNEAFLGGLQEFLADGTRRPLTDHVIVKSPGQVFYDLNVTYFLLKNQLGQAQELTAAVTKSVDDFINWQKSKIGRDVNPSELIYRMREAGAKRINVATPEFTTIEKGEVALPQTINIVFGGFEDE